MKKKNLVMSCYFPVELISNIFSRLPVKCLKKFKCVSKEIRDLVEDPSFIQSHLQQSIKSGSNNKLVLVPYESKFEMSIRFGDLNSIDSIGVQETTAWSMIQVTKVIGCCNGLLCLMSGAGYITMSNISTREHRILKCKLKEGEFPLGFGYSSIDDDYKLVIASSTKSNTESLNYATRVYSLKNQTWRNITSFLPKNYKLIHLSYKKGGSFLAGSLHSLAKIDGGGYLIVAFDLDTESFHEVAIPFELSSPNQLDLSVLGDCLCLTHLDMNMDIWVMEEYKVEKAWVKRFSVPRTWDGDSFLPLTYSANGDRVLLEDEISNVYWFDPNSQCVKVNTLNIPKGVTVVPQVCLQSLVRVRSTHICERLEMSDEALSGQVSQVCLQGESTEKTSDSLLSLCNVVCSLEPQGN